MNQTPHTRRGGKAPPHNRRFRPTSCRGAAPATRTRKVEDATRGREGRTQAGATGDKTQRQDHPMRRQNGLDWDWINYISTSKPTSSSWTTARDCGHALIATLAGRANTSELNNNKEFLFAPLIFHTCDDTNIRFPYFFFYIDLAYIVRCAVIENIILIYFYRYIGFF